MINLLVFLQSMRSVFSVTMRITDLFQLAHSYQATPAELKKRYLLLVLQEYKPVPKKRASVETAKQRRKSSKVVTDSSSSGSSDEDEPDEKVRNHYHSSYM